MKMDIPTSGPLVTHHNNMILERNTYSYFVNNETRGFRVVNTGIGTFLVAYTDQALAEQVFDLVLDDSYTLLMVENTDMITFFELVAGKEGREHPDGLRGILLNIPLSFIKGQDDFLPDDRIPYHVFTREEFEHLAQSGKGVRH